MSLRALRQAIGLTPGAGRLSAMQDVPLTPPFVEAPATTSPSPPRVVVVQEVTPVAVKVTVPATQANSIVTLSSTITAHLLSIDVAMMPPHCSYFLCIYV